MWTPHIPRPLCGLTLLLIACSDGSSPISQDGSAFSPGAMSMSVGSDGTCGPPTHPGGGLVENVTTPAAWGIAVRDDGLTYFTELFNGGVGITNTLTRTVEGFIPTGSTPTGLAFAPDGATAYVTNQGSQTLGVIDVSTAQQVATIFTPGGSPFVVRVSPDGSRVFVSTSNGMVHIVDAQTRQIIQSLAVGFAPNGFAVHPDSRIIYASAAFSGTVTEIDMFTGTALRTFTVGGRPQDMAVSKDGKRLYVANEAGFLNEVNLMTGQRMADIPLSGGAFGIGVTPDDVQAFVSIPGRGVVEVFNLQSRRLAQTIEVGGNPRRIAFSQRGHIGAIANLNGYITFVR